MEMTSMKNQISDVTKTIQCISEMLTHETSRVGRVGADFAIDFDQALLDDRYDFSTSQSIF